MPATAEWPVWVVDSVLLSEVFPSNSPRAEGLPVNNSPLKAREIEALTFVYGTLRPVSLGARNRWSRFFNWAWLKLRMRNPAPR